MVLGGSVLGGPSGRSPSRPPLNLSFHGVAATAPPGVFPDPTPPEEEEAGRGASFGMEVPPSKRSITEADVNLIATRVAQSLSHLLEQQLRNHELRLQAASRDQFAASSQRPTFVEPARASRSHSGTSPKYMSAASPGLPRAPSASFLSDGTSVVGLAGDGSGERATPALADSAEESDGLVVRASSTGTGLAAVTRRGSRATCRSSLTEPREQDLATTFGMALSALIHTETSDLGSPVRCLRTGSIEQGAPESRSAIMPSCSRSFGRWKTDGSMESLRRHIENEVTASIPRETTESTLHGESFKRSPDDAAGTSPRGKLASIEEQWQIAAPWPMRLCGMLQWQSGGAGRIRTVVLLASMSLAAYFAASLHYEVWSDRGARFATVFDLVIASGTTLGLMVIQWVQEFDVLGSPDATLARYARQQGIITQWAYASMWHRIELTAVWALTVLLRFLSGEDCGTFDSFTPLNALALCVRMLSTGIFLLIVASMLHACTGLALCVDSFCHRAVLNFQHDLRLGVQEWSVVQAVLRRVAGVFGGSFMTLQGTALTVALLLVDACFRSAVNWTLICAALLLFYAGLRVCTAAGHVTNKCIRVPRVIACVGSKNTVDQIRLIQHIEYTAAGFYVGDVRVRRSMVVLGYIGIVFATLAVLDE